MAWGQRVVIIVAILAISEALKTSLSPHPSPLVVALQRPAHRHGIQATKTSATTSTGLGTLCSTRQMKALTRSPSQEGLSVVRLKDLSRTEYVGILGVGTNCSAGACVPAAELDVVFDTGSSDIWVASDLCTQGACTMEGRHRFNRSTSSTFRADANPQAFQTAYATGTLSGMLGADDVWVGGTMRARGQKLGLIAEEYGSAFYSMPIDGIVGLGFSDLSDTKALMDTLVEEKVLQQIEFAFFFFRDVNKGGALIWGNAQQLQLHQGPLMWFPVVQEKFWSLPLRGFRLGRNSTMDLLHLLWPYEKKPDDGPFLRELTEVSDAPLSKKAHLIMDSGTTFFTAPQRLFNEITKVIEPAMCHYVHVFPELVFTVGTSLTNHSAVEELIIPPEVYMVRDGDDRCEPGFMNLAGLPEDPPMMILGEVFMRHYISIYRRGQIKGDSWVALAPTKADAEADLLLQKR